MSKKSMWMFFSVNQGLVFFISETIGKCPINFSSTIRVHEKIKLLVQGPVVYSFGSWYVLDFLAKTKLTARLIFTCPIDSRVLTRMFFLVGLFRYYGGTKLCE